MICPTSQAKYLRHNNATGKSGVERKILSSDQQLLRLSCPGRGASQSGATQSRDPHGDDPGAWKMGPGSAAQHSVLRGIRGTPRRHSPLDTPATRFVNRTLLA